jgi:predicted cobalt transporter CbtA
VLRNLLICGLVAGALGGLVATGFAEVVGEPAVNQAIGFEDAQAKAKHEAPMPQLVSRDVQRSAGLITAAVVYGLAFGGLFALMFAWVYGRVGRVSPGHTALLLAAGALLVVFLVPFVKYPANPPSVGHEDTIQRRTSLYFLMVWISIFAAVAAVRLRVVLAARGGATRATVLGALLYLVLVIGAGLALPGVHEVPRGFPAETLYRFREASIGMQLVMWATIGLAFAYAAERVMHGRPVFPRRSTARGAVATLRE